MVNSIRFPTSFTLDYSGTPTHQSRTTRRSERTRPSTLSSALTQSSSEGPRATVYTCAMVLSAKTSSFWGIPIRSCVAAHLVSTNGEEGLARLADHLGSRLRDGYESVTIHFTPTIPTNLIDGPTEGDEGLTEVQLENMIRGLMVPAENLIRRTSNRRFNVMRIQNPETLECPVPETGQVVPLDAWLDRSGNSSDKPGTPQVCHSRLS